MKMKSKTKEELLNNTIKRYNIETRSTDGSRCKYLNNDDRRCAIGIELNKPLARRLDMIEPNGVINDEVFKLLPKRLKKMGKDFLSEVQVLHDNRQYWTEEGLSRQGEFRVSEIRSKFL